MAQQIMLLLHGESYFLDKVLDRAMTGPTVEAKIEEIDPSFHARYTGMHTRAYNGPVVFVRHHNLYQVVAGQKAFEDAIAKGSTVVSGRLLSTVNIKKARWNRPVQA